jgi:hypothetical protein
MRAHLHVTHRMTFAPQRGVTQEDAAGLHSAGAFACSRCGGGRRRLPCSGGSRRYFGTFRQRWGTCRHEGTISWPPLTGCQTVIKLVCPGCFCGNQHVERNPAPGTARTLFLLRRFAGPGGGRSSDAGTPARRRSAATVAHPRSVNSCAGITARARTQQPAPSTIGGVELFKM